VAGGISLPFGGALVLRPDDGELEGPLDWELDGLLDPELEELLSVLALVLEPAAVLLSPTSRTTSHRPTPAAASSTTPATTRAISVLLVRFGGGAPGPPGGPHGWPGGPYGPYGPYGG
jgi:hypothetical protein